MKFEKAAALVEKGSNLVFEIGLAAVMVAIVAKTVIWAFSS